MSTENVTLLVFAAILCCLNLAFGPLAAGIAKVFGRFGRESNPADRADSASGPAGMPYREKAERHSPPGSDHVQFSSHAGCGCTVKTSHPAAVGEAQISKYR
jgi:hypothetical protein